jgi:hypothetical protein
MNVSCYKTNDFIVGVYINLLLIKLILSFIKGRGELCGNRGGRNEINIFLGGG